MLTTLGISLALLAQSPPYPLPALPEERAELVELGAQLFRSPLLSLDRSLACSSCHQPEHGFADTRALSIGVHGQSTLRNAPTLLNRAYGASFSWDGSTATLEAQVLRPISDPREMGLEPAALLARLAAEPAWAAEFERAGVARTTDGVAGALAAYVRRQWLADSPVDRFRRGATAILTDDERAGLWIYESSGGCWRCHSGPNFTDEEFHNTGIGVVDGVVEPGRAAVTGRDADRGAFKTPTLRGVARTAPYMHDGSLATLEDVIAHYRRGGVANAALDPRMRSVRLAEEDTRLLVAFLEALSRPAEPR
ncbi:MAG: cytochrome-c peroxidase [Planctomycetota bacterium]|nr:MAG: cytochrome-c peroxidase [Planctomycetota bacterium]